MTKRKFNFEIAIILLACSIASTANSQPGFHKEMKEAVYRILIPEGHSTFIEATGVLFSENNNYFLITNSHVLRKDSSEFRDSILVFVNRVQKNGEVISGPATRTIYLKKNDKILVFEPSIPQLDLALVSVGASNSTFVEGESLSSLLTKAIPNGALIDFLARPPAIVTLVGYPTKTQLAKERSPEYLWGDVLGVSGNYITSNIPALPGSSGSPVIVRSGDTYFLIGIHCAHVDSPFKAIAIRANLIFDSFREYFDRIRNGN